ncbi:hypothetical protein F5Y05DRAFT_412613 [Hypoxylon sp. FL0543]|nr:hypothetical protein F5Y05DRAFT_412613 [Hypoxylon sp. FL0543]
MSENRSTVDQTTTNLPSIATDSGTMINLFPNNVAAVINYAYSPTRYQESNSVTGDKAILTDPRGMILHEAATVDANCCLSGIGAGQTGSYILGKTFAQEIAAIFEVSGEKELKFSQRLN